MSREIIQLQVGQAGNNIGTKFWEVISDEHGIDKHGNYHGNSPVSQLERIDVYFAQGLAAEKYKPRAVLVDLDFVSLESIRSEPLGKFYNQDNFVSGYGGTEHNYAKGHYTDGAAIVDEAMDVLRKEAENCSSLQGFQMTHSLAGGTGSGLGTLLLSKIVDAYPDRMISTYSVVPSPKTLMEAWDPYNVVMACNSLITQSHATFCIDNEALYDICLDTQGVSSPTFDDLNHLVSATMSGVTAAFRYPGHVNETLMKMAVNMAPFPQLHFLLSGYAPLTKRGSPPKTNLTVPEVAQHLFDAKSMLAACDPSHGRSLTTAAHFRGPMTLKEVDEQMQQVRDKNSNYFVDWIPDNVLTSVCKIPPQGLNMSGTYIANSTAIKKVFQRISTQFAKLYKRKAFLNKYSSEGLYEIEIQEADYNVRNLIKEYQQYEDATAD